MKPRKPQYSSSETRWKNVGGGRKRDGREAVEESQTRPSVRIRVVRQGREKPQRRCTKVEGWWKVETEVRHHHRHHQRQQRAAMLRKHGTSPWKAAIRENDTTRTGKMANVVLPVLLLIPPFPSLESFEFVVVGIECQLEESRGLLIKRGRWIRRVVFRTWNNGSLTIVIRGKVRIYTGYNFGIIRVSTGNERV